MHFQIARAELQRQLHHVAGAVARGTGFHGLPILGNVLAEIRGSQLRLTGSDSEVTMSGICSVTEASEDTAITVPAKKLLDIVRALPSSVSTVDARLVETGNLQLRAGAGRYTLATLPAAGYPERPAIGDATRITVSDALLSTMTQSVSYAMANGDKRAYLNGMLLHLAGPTITCVGTDGSRMGVARAALSERVAAETRVIVARRGVAAMQAMLTGSDEPVELYVGARHLGIAKGDQKLVASLIDGAYPDYGRVVPAASRHQVPLERRVLLDAVKRTAIVGSDIKDAVVLDFTGDTLRISASAVEKGDASEEIPVPCQDIHFRMGVNARYLIDALSALSEDAVHMRLNTPTDSILLTNGDGSDHIIMPLRF